VDFPEHRTHIPRQKNTPRPEDFPPEVEDALSHLSRFTKLDTVIVEFSWDDEHYMDSPYSRMRRETVAELQEAESRMNWRALMAKSYAALAKNKSGVVTKLAMKNVLAQETTVWRSDGWRKLLGGLGAFECGLKDGDDPREMPLSMLDHYAYSVQTLYMSFSGHLDSVQDVHLFAPKQGPVGIDLPHIVPLSLQPDSMPRLQRLTLRYFFLSGSLVQFLTAHSRTLRSVRLYNVYVTDEHRMYPVNSELESWKHFFDTLLYANPVFPELREFDLAWGFDYGTMGADCIEDVEHIKDERTSSPFRLPYAFVDEDDGALLEADFGAVEEVMGFDNDSDLIAYRNFLEVLGIKESVWPNS
jgi:hypothetical protein